MKGRQSVYIPFVVFRGCDKLRYKKDQRNMINPAYELKGNVNNTNTY
jgi:hypothetical protein